MGDFNLDVKEVSLHLFCNQCKLKSPNKDPTCYKNVDNLSCQWRIQRLIWAHRERGIISWGSVSPPPGTGQSPVGGQGVKPMENFDDLLVKITFLKLNMPFYET